MGWLDHILEQLVSLIIFLPFTPPFVAFNVLGILPIFSSLTSERVQPEGKRVIRQSVLTAFWVSIGFLGAGESVFALLGILVTDFQIQYFGYRSQIFEGILYANPGSRG